MAYFTFGLRYPDGDVEEIDVERPSYQDARQEALRIAREGYQPGWTLIDLPPGGSSGFVQIFQLG